MSVSRSRRESARDQRAASSIGTLIIFIALVLVASITAGVLFDTVGLLSGQTEQTSDETAGKISDRLEVVTITGNNISEDGGQREVNRIEMIVTQAEGSEPIDLRNVTVQWVANRSYTLSHENSTDDPDEDSFSTVRYTDEDDSFPTLTSADDRFSLAFEPGVEFGTALKEGQRVDVVLLSPSGTTLELSFKIPRSLLGKDSFEM